MFPQMPVNNMTAFSFVRHGSFYSKTLLPVVVCSTSRMTLTFILTLTLPLGSRMYPHGPPHQACDSMLPHHGAAPQHTSTSPYNLVVDDVTTYSPNQQIKVTIKGTPFIGFMLQVRRAASSNVVTLPLGTFLSPPPYARYLDCSEKADTITHASNGPKWNMEFTWRPPDRSYGPVHFIATLVFTKDTYWMNVTSRVLYPKDFPETTLLPLPVTSLTTHMLNSTTSAIAPTTSASTMPYFKEFTLVTVSMATRMTSRVELKTTPSHMIVEQDHFPLIGVATAAGPLPYTVIAILLSAATLEIL